MRAKAAEKALIGSSADAGRHRGGAGRRRRRHVADHRSDRQRLVSQRGPAGAFPPAAAWLKHVGNAPADSAREEEEWRKVPVQFTLNGDEKAEFVESGATLLKALRDKIGDTSPKGGCHQGTCGACSVHHRRRTEALLPDAGRDVRRRRASSRRRASPKDGVLHPLQRAFLDGFRRAMRLLHAGHDHGGQGAARPHAQSQRARRWSRRCPATSAAAPATSRSSRRCCPLPAPTRTTRPEESR